jgi:hypothetical protein
MTQSMTTEKETPAVAIERPVRRTKTRGPVAIQKGERGFVLHFESEPQEWTLEFDCAATSDLAAVAAGSALPTIENLPTLLKLRQFGLVVLNDRGEIVEPLMLSELGDQVKRALEQMSDSSPGMTLTLHIGTKPREWSLELPYTAMADFDAIAAGSPLPVDENLSTIRELRKFGLLVLGDRGELVEPVTLSDHGHEVKRALMQMSDARRGMTLDLQAEFNHTGKANLTEQMAGLLVFTGCVATAIMQYSAYNSQFRDVADLAPEDLMWLGACLSDFEGLGKAIARNDQKRTVYLCDDLIGKYRGYQVINPIYTRQAKPTFDRQSKLVKLDDAIALLESIKAAVQEISQ